MRGPSGHTSTALLPAEPSRSSWTTLEGPTGAQKQRQKWGAEPEATGQSAQQGPSSWLAPINQTEDAKIQPQKFIFSGGAGGLL